MTLDDAVQKACGHLPDGWEISVACERGAGWIELRNPDGEYVNFDSSPDKSLAEQVDDALVEALSTIAL